MTGPSLSTGGGSPGWGAGISVDMAVFLDSLDQASQTLALGVAPCASAA